jgi:CHAT domain-containing protein
MTNFAEIYVQKKKYDSAFRYFQFSFDQFKPGGNEADILHASPEKLQEIKKIDYVTRLVNCKGDAYMQKFQVSGDIHDLRNSIHVYKIMDSLLDRIKTEQIEIESKLFWRNTTRQMYEHAIEACYLAGDLDNAFYFFEKSRAIILNDLLTEQHGQTNNDMLELSRARKKVNMLEREMQNIDSSSAAATEMQKKLLDSRYQLDQLKQAIKEKNPLYYQNFLDPNQTTLKDIDKKILNDHQALLEIYDGEHAVYSLLVTRQRTYFNKIDKDDYDRRARLYLSFLSNPDLLNSHVTEFERTAHQLYEMIFRNSAIPAGRIIISPDGAYFPFEALVTDNRKPGSPVYFIQDHAVSYTYSARYLMNDFRNNENKTNGSVLGIAPVHYPYISSLNPLIGSDLSLNIVESYFKGGHTLTEGNASRNNFLMQFSNYSVIQLYTHASDSSDRKEPVIYFSDSSLYLSELVQESKPSTKLVVISACNTGNGKLYLGEGIFSFNRAFATVGIPASVINLWSIDSKSTYRLTELFYKYLSAGLTTDRALQSAKLEFMHNADRKQTLPYYWAPSILIGKTEIIDFNRQITLKTWVISGAIFVFLFLIWWFWKKRESFRHRIRNRSGLLVKTGEV